MSCLVQDPLAQQQYTAVIGINNQQTTDTLQYDTDKLSVSDK